MPREPSEARAKPKAPAKKKQATPLQYETVAQHILQGYFPQMHGCTVSVETEWHHRVKVCYPKDVMPFSTSMTFEKGGSQRAAILHCLKWAWQEHEEATSVMCPYDLPEF